MVAEALAAVTLLLYVLPSNCSLLTDQATQSRCEIRLLAVLVVFKLTKDSPGQEWPVDIKAAYRATASCVTA
jgi:hypothetical protein